MKMVYVSPKKATDKDLLEYLKANHSMPVEELTDVELKSFMAVRHEVKRRKIGPSQINLQLAKAWRTENYKA